MRNISVLISILFTSFLASTVVYGIQQIDITKKGTPNGTIIISKGATLGDKFAAEELVKYLKIISGATLSVLTQDEKPSGQTPCIFVGENPFLKKKNIVVDSDSEDAYIIKTMEKSTIVLLGNGERGTTYSVYHFLKKLGCRWYMPGSLGEEIPKTDTIRIENGISLLEVPDFELRHYKADGGRPVLNAKDSISLYHWMLKNRINRGYKGDLSNFNTFKGSFGHTYKKIIPKKIFNSNPEFFPLIDGAREDNGQRCTSNKDLINETKLYVDQFFKENKTAKIVSISPNDNTKWCECIDCVTLDGSPNTVMGTTKKIRIYSGRVHRYASEIAEYMKEKHPGKYAYVYAYSHYTPYPPPLSKQKKFEVIDNLIVNICYNLNAVDNRSIIDPDCEISQWYRENIIEQWTEKALNVWFHQYTYRWSALEILWPMWQVAASDMQYLYEKGIWGFFASGGKSNWGSNGLYYYAVAQLMWNVNTDIDQLINDYCNDFYKESSSFMKNYFKHMEHSVTKSQFVLRNYPGILEYITQTPDIYTDKVMKKGLDYLESAIRKAPSEKIKKRIDIILFTHNYTWKLMDFLKSYTVCQKSKKKIDIQAAIDSGTSVTEYIKSNYVLWSITKKTADGYGAEEFVSNMTKRLKKKL